MTFISHRKSRIVARILLSLLFAMTFSEICISGADDCTSHYQKAQEYLEEGRTLYEKAIYELKIASQDSTLMLNCYKLLGDIYVSKGNLQEAREAFELVLKASPLDMETSKKLALVYYRDAEFTKSLELYQRIPQDPEVLYYLGSIYAKKNMWDKALVCFKMLRIKELKSNDTTWTKLAEEETKAVDDTCSQEVKDLEPKIQDIIKRAPSQKDYPNAGAIVLFREKHLTVNDNSSELEEHCLIKILNSKGREEFGEIRIKFDDTYEIVDVDVARIITPGGRVIPVSRKYFKDVTPWSELPEYSNSKMKIISFPQIEEGSIIEYRFTKHSIKLLAQNEFFTKYYLQTAEPILLQTCAVTFPKSRKIHVKLLGGTQGMRIPDPETMVTGNEKTIKWEIRNTPEALQEEEMPPWDEVIPQIWVSSFESWTEIHAWLETLYEEKMKPDKAIADKVNELIRDRRNGREKAKAIYDWVVTNIRYVALEYGEGGFEPHVVSDVFKNRYGDCKDQTCLLVSMLRLANVEAYPVLIGTYTAPFASDIPMPQFNHCIGVTKLDGEYLFLDPISETCPFGYLPVSNQERTTMVFLDNDYKFVKTPLFKPEINKETREMKISVHEDGSIKVEKKGVFMGEKGIRFKHWLRDIDPTKRKESFEEEISQSCPGGILSNYIIDGLNDLDTPLAITEEFHVSHWLHDIGDGKLTLKLPTIAIDVAGTAKEKRRYPVRCEYTKSKEYSIEIVLPRNYKLLLRPEDLNLNTPYGSFLYHVENQSDTVKVHISWEQNTITIPLEAYREYRALSEKINRKLNEELVLVNSEH